MSSPQAELLADLDQMETLTPAQRTERLSRAASWREANDQAWEQLLAALARRDPPRPGSAAEALWGAVLFQLPARYRGQREVRERLKLSPAVRSAATGLYAHLGAASQVRHHLLGALAESRGPNDLAELARLLTSDPPQGSTAAAVVMLPLVQHQDYDPAPLFPVLLAALDQPALAPVVLDLANHLTRQGRVPRHPAADQAQHLAALLGGVAQRLDRLQEQPQESAQSAAELQQIVADSVPLAIGLCDALGLIGDPSVTGKLYQALALEHRRLRVEAAAALSRLGEEAGTTALVELAAEPLVRLRVLHYAQELGLLDKVGEEYKSPVSRAEAELVSWLALPTHFGLAPTSCELLDSRTLYWPGYDQPVVCYLFRFGYELPQGSYANVGIVGPLVHAFAADLNDLSPEDIYAVFAGWEAEHAEISATPTEQFTPAQAQAAQSRGAELRTAGYDSLSPQLWGQFFGQGVLVATAVRQGVFGVVVADERDIQWQPSVSGRRPLGPGEAWSLYKGRRLLKAFNPGSVEN